MSANSVAFGDVPMGGRFRHGKRIWRRVDKAVDKLGGYNAQLVGTARRRALFFALQEVEALDGRDELGHP